MDTARCVVPEKRLPRTGRCRPTEIDMFPMLHFSSPICKPNMMLLTVYQEMQPPKPHIPHSFSSESCVLRRNNLGKPGGLVFSPLLPLEAVFSLFVMNSFPSQLYQARASAEDVQAKHGGFGTYIPTFAICNLGNDPPVPLP